MLPFAGGVNSDVEDIPAWFETTAGEALKMTLTGSNGDFNGLLRYCMVEPQ